MALNDPELKQPNKKLPSIVEVEGSFYSFNIKQNSILTSALVVIQTSNK